MHLRRAQLGTAAVHRQLGEEGTLLMRNKRAAAGQCEYDQIRSITKLLGLPPAEMLSMGSKTKRPGLKQECASPQSCGFPSR